MLGIPESLQEMGLHDVPWSLKFLECLCSEGLWWLPDTISCAGRGLRSRLLTVSVTLGMSLNLAEPQVPNPTVRILVGNSWHTGGVATFGELTLGFV